MPKRKRLDGTLTPKQRKAWVSIHTTKRRALYTNQLTPVHDYINFKNMSGNEILLNLQNVEHLALTELLGALNQLVGIPERERKRRDIKWMDNPIIQDCVWRLKANIPYMTARQLMQVPHLIDKFRWLDNALWRKCEHNILRILHKYKANDIAMFLDVFDRDFADSNGKKLVGFRKATPEFFERIVAILPMYLPNFNNSQLLRVFEVMVKRHLGSERLFLNYIYPQLERKVLSYDGREYIRLLRSLTQKGFQDDKVFWNDFIFDYLRPDKDGNPKGRFKQEHAKVIYGLLEKIKTQLSNVDVAEAMEHVAKYLPAKKKKHVQESSSSSDDEIPP